MKNKIDHTDPAKTMNLERGMGGALCVSLVVA